MYCEARCSGRRFCNNRGIPRLQCCGEIVIDTGDDSEASNQGEAVGITMGDTLERSSQKESAVVDKSYPEDVIGHEDII